MRRGGTRGGRRWQAVKAYLRACGARYTRSRDTRRWHWQAGRQRARRTARVEGLRAGRRGKERYSACTSGRDPARPAQELEEDGAKSAQAAGRGAWRTATKRTEVPKDERRTLGSPGARAGFLPALYAIERGLRVDVGVSTKRAWASADRQGDSSLAPRRRSASTYAHARMDDAGYPCRAPTGE